MQIRCPQCQFTQEINPDRIPATAVMATCPRCKNRFRFRSLQPEDEAAPVAEQPRVPETDRPASEKRTSAPLSPPPAQQGSGDMTGHAEDDPLPPGAVIPDAGLDAESRARQNRPEDQDDKREADRDDAQHESQRPARLSTDQGADSRSFADRIREATSGATAFFPSVDDKQSQEIPWEHPDKYGIWGGLYQTVLRVLFGAPRFFSALSAATAPLTRPALFYIILGMFQTVAKLIWFRTVDPSITAPRVQEMLSSAAEGISVPMTLLLAPGLLLIQLFLYSGLFYLMLRLVQPERSVFSTVLRVVAYSSAPMVLSLVPFLGPLVAPVWFAVCCFIGCKYALKIGWHQVALALVPLYLIAFAIAMQIVQRLLAQG